MYEPRPIPRDGIQAVLLDLDGTLIESDDRWVANIAARLAWLRRLNRKLDPAVIARWVVMHLETPSNYALSFIEHCGLKTTFFGLTDRMRRARGLATRGASTLVEGSERLLEALGSQFKLAVVTTRARPEALAFLDASGLRPYFGTVITRQDVLRMKPNPEPVLVAAKRLGVRPNACLMIGDTLNDVLAARRAGAYAIGVLSGFGERHELERSGADLILDRAADLLDQPQWGDSEV